MKIAVCISGLIRYWEQTYPLFEYWNKLFDDVEFYFFISTWENPKEFIGLRDENQEYRDLIEKSLDFNFSNHKFITDYSLMSRKNILHLLDEINTTMSEVTQRSVKTFIHMAYGIKNVQELRKKYEKENGFIFDGVIQTRNDAFFNKDTLTSYKNLIDYDKFLNNKSIYIPGGCSVQDGEMYLFINDNLSFGSSAVMDTYGEIFNEVFIKKASYQNKLHFAPAYYFYNKNIGVYSMGTIKIIRPSFFLNPKNNMWDLYGHPTPEVMTEILDTHGVEYFYHTPVKLLDDMFDKYWDKIR